MTRAIEKRLRPVGDEGLTFEVYAYAPATDMLRSDQVRMSVDIRSGYFIFVLEPDEARQLAQHLLTVAAVAEASRGTKEAAAERVPSETAVSA